MNNLSLSVFDPDYYKQIMREWSDPLLGKRNRESYYYNVVDDKNNRIGIIGLFVSKNKYCAEVAIDPKYRGKSYLLKFYELLVETKNIDELYATIFTNNLISIKAHEKIGFEKILEFDMPKDEPNPPGLKCFVYKKNFK